MNNEFRQPFHLTQPPVNNSTGELEGGHNEEHILKTFPKVLSAPCWIESAQQRAQRGGISVFCSCLWRRVPR